MRTRHHNSGFTLIELLIVIVVIGILAAIIFPVFAAAREKARQITCASNEKQLGAALLQYIQDNDDRMPLYEPVISWGPKPKYRINTKLSGISIRWWHGLYPYAKTKRIFCCPTQPKADPSESVTYNWNQAYQAVPANLMTTPAVDIVLYDRIPGSWVDFDTSEAVTTVQKQPVTYTNKIMEGTGHGQALAPGPYAYLNTTLGNGGATSKCPGDYYTNKTIHNGAGDNFLFADGHVKYAVWSDPTVSPQAMANDMYPVIGRNICWY